MNNATSLLLKPFSSSGKPLRVSYSVGKVSTTDGSTSYCDAVRIVSITAS